MLALQVQIYTVVPPIVSVVAVVFPVQAPQFAEAVLENPESFSKAVELDDPHSHPVVLI